MWHSLVQDWERLHSAFVDMRAYWNRLDRKRKQLEGEEKEQMVSRAVGTTLPQNIRHVQHDLRDLMSQVSSQVSTSSLLKHTRIVNPHIKYFGGMTPWF